MERDENWSRRSFLKAGLSIGATVGAMRAGGAGAAPAAGTGSARNDLLELTAAEAVSQMRFGGLSAEDYARAGLPMLPVTHGAEFTRLHVFLYTIVLFAGTMLPFAYGMSGWIYLAAAIALGGTFIVYGYRLWRDYSDTLARKVFRFSILHLSLLFAALLIDHYLSPLLA